METRIRTTTEYLSENSSTELAITGTMTFRGKPLDFEWRSQDSEGCSFRLYFGDYKEGLDVLIEEMDRIFPSQRSRPTPVLHPTPEENARGLGGMLGCLLPLLFILGVIGFAIYGFLVWLGRIS